MANIVITSSLSSDTVCQHSYITRFNNIAIQARAQMATDKEAVGLSKVHMYESKCIMPLQDNCTLTLIGCTHPVVNLAHSFTVLSDKEYLL